MEEYGLGSFLKSLNPLHLTSVIYHMRYFFWSLFIALLIVYVTIPQWTILTWAALLFLTLCLYLIFTATPLLQASPYFIPAISPYPPVLDLNGISKDASSSGKY